MDDSATLLEQIEALFIKEELPLKSLLVREGTLAKKLFYIQTGACRAWFNTADGKEITMNFGFEGSFVSSMETIIAGEPSWYTVETLEPTVAYSLSLSTFRELRVTHPAVQRFYHEHVERRLLHYQQLFISRIKDKPEERYRQLLAHHPDIIRRVPQHYVASFLGITAVSLSRIRNRR